MASPASMPVQATGNTQSGGLNGGSRNARYHAIVRGWLGDGLLEALSASGIVKAQEAMLAAAAGESTGRLDVVLVMRYRIGLEATRLQVASA